MTLFQVIALALLAALLVRELVVLARGTARRPAWLVRVVVWIGAAVSIAVPNLVQNVASAVGIGRGADVVLYLFVFAFLGTSFYFYACHATLERQITELVRCQAIDNASRSPARADRPTAATASPADAAANRTEAHSP